MDNLSFDQFNKINDSFVNYNGVNNPIQNKQFDENQYFLLLSIYFYLKHNNHHVTAETLFEECKLGQVFVFPQNIVDEKTEIDKLKKKFLSFFYFNTYFSRAQKNENNDFLAEFWNQFWEIFVIKIKQVNPNISRIDSYLLSETQPKLTYNTEVLHRNIYDKIDN